MDSYDPATADALSLRRMILEETHEKAKKINRAAPVPWDYQVLISEFVDWNKDKNLNTVNGAFLGFVRKKVQKAP